MSIRSFIETALPPTFGPGVPGGTAEPKVRLTQPRAGSERCDRVAGTFESIAYRLGDTHALRMVTMHAHRVGVDRDGRPVESGDVACADDVEHPVGGLGRIVDDCVWMTPRDQCAIVVLGAIRVDFPRGA